MNFLGRDNICGHSLAKIVSRGNAIIAELHRLSEIIPPPFRSDRPEFNLYKEIVSDFSYFNESDSIENRIESNAALKQKDSELCDTYLDIITRYYLTFESIHRYSVDLNVFIEELEDGSYIGQTMDSVLQDIDGRQLLCEAYFLLGFMLIAIDQNFDGLTRERIIVSYYRYSAFKTSSGSSLDDTSNLLRSTGYDRQTGRRPANYPEKYFSRTGVNQAVINLLIAKLQSDDIYNQIVTTFPNPEHRSFALAQQASMLYVILFFVPDVLTMQHAKMREIVDRFFPDNWIISVYMGSVVNLIEAWEPYKAARQALCNSLEVENIKYVCNKFHDRFDKVMPQIQVMLREGWLELDSVLENSTKILNNLRESNIVLRWSLLHSYYNNKWQVRKCRAVLELVQNSNLGINLDNLFILLQNTAQLEQTFRELYRQLLDSKFIRINKLKNETIELLDELESIFAGVQTLRGVEKNRNLEKVFNDILNELKLLQFSTDESNQSHNRQDVVKLLRKINEVQEIYQMESNLQVKQLVLDTCRNLTLIMRNLSLNNDTLISLQIIGDLSYAWEIMDTSFTKQMQKAIRDDPRQVAKIRYTFLKLASAFDLSLIRINQVNSPDLLSVSQFYSSQLVSYIRKVLHIIPETMFSFVAQVISLQTDRINELPSRISLNNLRDFAFLEERDEVAHLTYKISLYAEGMLMMRETAIGVIKIDSKQLLVDGIRRELVKQAAEAIHSKLIFNSKAKSSELVSKLMGLVKIMDGYKRSFEYIQDYVFIYGLRMWQEEVSRIIKFNVEQECNMYTKQKVLDWQSVYQSQRVPIPMFAKVDQSTNFIGRLVAETLRVTSPKTTIHDDQMSAWYDSKTKEFIIDMKLFDLINASIGTAGLNGFDQVCSTMIMDNVQKLDNFIESTLMREKSLGSLFVDLKNKLARQSILEDSARYHANLASKCSRFLTGTVLETILQIGQLQIIRANIAHCLSSHCRSKARNFYSCLYTLNDALMTTLNNQLSDQPTTSDSGEIQHDSPKLNPTSSSHHCGDDSQLLFELTNHLEWIGLSDPLTKVYTTNISSNHKHLESIIFLLILTQMPKFTYSKAISGLVPKISRISSETIDAIPLIYGVITFIQQYQSTKNVTIIDYMCYYIRSVFKQTGGPNKSLTELPSDLLNMISCLIEYLRIGRFPRSIMKSKLPTFILETLEFNVCHVR